MIISRPGFAPIDDGADKPKQLPQKADVAAIRAKLAAQKAATATTVAGNGPSMPAPVVPTQILAQPAPLPIVNATEPAPAVEHGPVPHAINVPHAI
jgi:hypothetical protein